MSSAPQNRRTLIRAALASGTALALVGGVLAAAMATGTTGLAGATSKLPAVTATDLACGKPTTATSTSDSTNPASNATDCTAGTTWLSNPSTSPQSIQVNLGATTAVDHVTIIWGANYATSFKVRTSPDGTTWHTTNTVTGATGGTETIALPAGTSTEWVQLYLEQSVMDRTFSIDELQVFGAPGSAAPTPSTPVATPTTPSNALWTGQFTGFGTTAWQQAWGYTATGAWGAPDLSEVSDPTAPGDGSALRVYYGAGSSANSCTDCPNPGGGQFYQQLSSLGSAGTTMENSATLDLKYSIKLPAGWDFGEAGKLPGLYGGVIGEESGGDHGADGWSTRYMFRDHDGTPNAGEIYLYTPTNSGPTGYGVDYFGNWNWTSDGNWHTVEQLVNRQTGSVTVWFDGQQVLNDANIATGISKIPFSGVFFSTFFGGHDTSWGPKVTEYSYFADFSLSTAVQH